MRFAMKTLSHIGGDYMFDINSLINDLNDFFKETGMSKREFCRRCNVSASVLTRILNGERSSITTRTFVRFSNGLHKLSKENDLSICSAQRSIVDEYINKLTLNEVNELITKLEIIREKLIEEELEIKRIELRELEKMYNNLKEGEA